jgi:hypothetical protein
MTGNSGHKAAQRMYKAERCSLCGGTTTLQRHHIDRNPTNNDPSNVQILCQHCHAEEHKVAMDWGRGMVKQRTCAVCGAIFQPTRSRRGKLCGKPECLREMGRRSAELRWRQKTESTGLEPLETDRFRQWQQQHGSY